MSQLCGAVERSRVRSLHLLHMSLERVGFRALAALVVGSVTADVPSGGVLTGLDLSGCWAGRAADPHYPTVGPRLHDDDAPFRSLFFVRRQK